MQNESFEPAIDMPKIDPALGVWKHVNLDWDASEQYCALCSRNPSSKAVVYLALQKPDSGADSHEGAARLYSVADAGGPRP
jgi:hypothetical protein